MLRALVKRARAIGERLGAEIPPFEVEGNANNSTYIGFFERLFANFEKVVTNLDGLVEKESRELLAHAITRIFANLAHLQPNLDFKTVTAPLQGAAMEKAGAVYSEVDEYVQLFERVEGEPAEDDGEESSEDGSFGEED